MLIPGQNEAYRAGVAYAAEVIAGHLGSADSLNKEDVKKAFPNLWKKIEELKSYKPKDDTWEKHV